MQELRQMIEEQRKGHEFEPLWTVGAQLMDMAEREPKTLEMLKQDLSVTGMGLKDAAAALKAYADKHHKKAREFCIPPHVAEDILRDFYKIPKMEEANVHNLGKDARCEEAQEDKKPAFVGLSLADFM